MRNKISQNLKSWDIPSQPKCLICQPPSGLPDLGGGGNGRVRWQEQLSGSQLGDGLDGGNTYSWDGNMLPAWAAMAVLPPAQLTGGLLEPSWLALEIMAQWSGSRLRGHDGLGNWMTGAGGLPVAKEMDTDAGWWLRGQGRGMWSCLQKALEGGRIYKAVLILLSYM